MFVRMCSEFDVDCSEISQQLKQQVASSVVTRIFFFDIAFLK